MQPINRYAASAPTPPAPACLTRRALVGAAALVGLGGCAASLDAGAGSASDGVDPNRTVTIAMSPESEPAAGFDPLVSWGCGEHVHEPLIQSTLVVTDDAMNVTGDLATEFLCSDDGLVWTFTIRDDAVFSDGEPCTAEDVAFTIDRVAHGDTSQADLSMVDAAVALNDRTVELRLSRPHNALLYTLAVLGIVPAHAYGDGYGSAPIGSGRYLLERWDRGQQVVLAANPSCRRRPAMERVVVVFMEEDAALAAVRAGEVDLAYTSPVRASEDVVGYELVAYGTVDSRGISLPTGPAGGTKVDDGGVAYDAGNAVTSDVAVRRAMVTGVDRAALIDEVLNGYGTVAYSVGDGMPWSSDDMRVECDAGAARRMLEEAGWLLGSDGVRARDGLRASIDLWYTAGDSARQAIAHAFADQMSELGIEVCPRGASWTRSTCTSMPARFCGAGARMPPSRSTSCIIPRVGAITRATRATSSTPGSMRRWPSRNSRIPMTCGSARCGTEPRAWHRRARRPGAGSPTSITCTGSAKGSTSPSDRIRMGTDGRS